jgi:hypothetical protein
LIETAMAWLMFAKDQTYGASTHSVASCKKIASGGPCFEISGETKACGVSIHALGVQTLLKISAVWSRGSNPK